MSEAVSMLDRAARAPRPGLSLADRGPVGQVTLRGDLADAALAKAVRTGVGVGVPGPLSSEWAGDGRGAVWMSPDELLLLTAYEEAPGLAARLDAALEGTHRMALDVSDARAVLRLEGRDAAETLAKGVPVDVSDAAFPVGHARRTHLGSVAVGLWRLGPESWEIVCFRSYARHVFAWLETTGAAGAEVGRF